MLTKSKRLMLTGAFAVALGGLTALSSTASADVDTREFKVVGTWGNLQLWKEHESRYWNDILPKISGGKPTANAKPYTELGLSGFEVMRLLATASVSMWANVVAVTRSP